MSTAMNAQSQPVSSSTFENRREASIVGSSKAIILSGSRAPVRSGQRTDAALQAVIITNELPPTSNTKDEIGKGTIGYTSTTSVIGHVWERRRDSSVGTISSETVVRIEDDGSH